MKIFRIESRVYPRQTANPQEKFFEKTLRWKFPLANVERESFMVVGPDRETVPDIVLQLPQYGKGFLFELTERTAHHSLSKEKFEQAKIAEAFSLQETYWTYLLLMAENLSSLNNVRFCLGIIERLGNNLINDREAQVELNRSARRANRINCQTNPVNYDELYSQLAGR